MQSYAWVLLAAPLLGFALNGAFGRRLSRGQISAIGCGSIAVAFAVALLCYAQLLGWTGHDQATRGNFNYYTWASSGALRIQAGMLIDPLSATMLLVVTGVGLLIHVYSIGYMHDDPDYSRFFAYMNLFLFSMLMLVLANNFLFLLIGWGLVGLSSYLLIGFWYYNVSAVLAARKALIMNVIGDVGIMLAIFTMFRQWGDISYSGVFARAAAYKSGDHIITAVCLLLLVGALAKSAQIPLHTWLPDAMEGPTPVSALIHAATMVTAGVYLIARCHVLYDLSPFSAGLVACIGAVTAVVAATIALVQTDIKRVLAYSTMSQIGYMFLGVGVGAYSSGMFHLVTHAFFKALLFMGAGSVIHALGGEQDLRKMGALRSRLPKTYLVFTVGVLAIAGVPPLSGFWSKDEILAHAYALNDWHVILWAMGMITAGMTVFYMFRLWYLAFHGRSRLGKEVAAHLHESPTSMLLPMYVLSALAVVGGFLQTPAWGGLHEFLRPVMDRLPDRAYTLLPARWDREVDFQWGAFAILLVLIAAGWFVARDLYHQGPRSEREIPTLIRPLYTFFSHKWYFDELYHVLFEVPVYALATLSWRWVDRGFIDPIVNGVAAGVGSASDDLRPVESGYVRTYALALVVGVLLVVGLAVAQR